MTQKGLQGAGHTGCTVGAHVSAFCLQRTFKEFGIGYPFGMQLHGKTLGIIGMGAIGEPSVCLLSMP